MFSEKKKKKMTGRANMLSKYYQQRKCNVN